MLKRAPSFHGQASAATCDYLAVALDGGCRANEAGGVSPRVRVDDRGGGRWGSQAGAGVLLGPRGGYLVLVELQEVVGGGD